MRVLKYAKEETYYNGVYKGARVLKYASMQTKKGMQVLLNTIILSYNNTVCLKLYKCNLLNANLLINTSHA